MQVITSRIALLIVETDMNPLKWTSTWGSTELNIRTQWLARIQGNETHAMDMCDNAVIKHNEFESFIKRPHKCARLTGPSLAQHFCSGNRISCSVTSSKLL